MTAAQMHSRPSSPFFTDRSTPYTQPNTPYWSGLSSYSTSQMSDASGFSEKRYASPAPPQKRATAFHFRDDSNASYHPVSGTASPMLDPRVSIGTAADSVSSKSRVKMAPLFKKFTPREANSLDLSRSAAENEMNGVYSTDFGARSAAELDAMPSERKKGFFHTRSTSGTSQFSTTTTGSGYRQGTQYVHPRRQTPRPYTPPLSQSHGTSVLGSEYSAEGDEEEAPRRLKSHRSVSFGSHAQQQLPLRVRTNTDSSQRLLHGSHTNLSITPSSLRLTSDPMSPTETLSPVSRKSFDRAFRSRRRDDSASFAESVHAARAEWNAKQASKALKLEKTALKAAEKEERARQKREAAARKREAKISSRPMNEKGDLGSTAYSNIASNNFHSGASHAQNQNRSGVKVRWTAFVVWVRIRMVKIGRKVGNLF